MQISRRDALMGATAAAITTGAITVPVAIKAAGVKAALVGEPLVALEAKLLEARAASDKIWALYGAASDEAGDWTVGWPVADFSNPALERMRGWISDQPDQRVDLDIIRQFNHRNEASANGDQESLAWRKAEGRERVRWWIKARRTQEAAREAAGLPKLEALVESSSRRTSALEDQILDTPPETLRGAVIKLRETHHDYVDANYLGKGDEDFYAVAFGQVLRDLERLTGEART